MLQAKGVAKLMTDHIASPCRDRSDTGGDQQTGGDELVPIRVPGLATQLSGGRDGPDSGHR
jgi:hypothetical protein